MTARAVSALKTLIPLTAPLLKPGGELLLLKGVNVAAEITAAQKQIKRFELSNLETIVLGSNLLVDETRVVRAVYRANVSRET